MKRLSVKARLTLWYALLLLLICALSALALLSAAERTERAYCLKMLENAATMLVDELEYEHGELEIDSDIDDVPNVYASLFEEDGRLIYGRRRVDLPFEDGAMRRVQSGGHDWYVYDLRLAYAERADVWLRLYTSMDVSQSAWLSMLHYGFWLFPLLAVLALAGGYLLTARAFRPVRRMTELAVSIASGGDLSRRIGPGGAKDELHALSAAFDGMLERLERAFKRERSFTSDVAHELRTPMNAIATQCEYALSRGDAGEKDAALERILEKNEEMNALVRQLLLIARMESGQMERGDECPLDVMLADIAEDMGPVAAERGIRIEAELCPCAIRGNRAILARAFVNLVDNAIRYGRAGGRVALRMELTPAQVAVSVADDGCGIAREDLPMIFERFWRADGARSTPGTGIGLSIVKTAVEAHGGSISVDSAPGKGTAFRILLNR